MTEPSELPPGAPGMIALASVTAAGAVLSGFSYMWNLYPVQVMGRPHGRLQSYALITGLTALYFWAWAMMNTARHSFDLGTISFLFPFFTSVYIFSRQPTSSMQIDVLRRQRLAALLCPLLPCGNYLLAVVALASTPGPLLTYMILGASWWLCASILGALIVHSQIIWLLGGVAEMDHLEE